MRLDKYGHSEMSFSLELTVGWLLLSNQSLICHWAIKILILADPFIMFNFIIIINIMCFLKHLRLDSTKPFPAYKEYSIAKEELEDFSRDCTCFLTKKHKFNFLLPLSPVSAFPGEPAHTHTIPSLQTNSNPFYIWLPLIIAQFKAYKR